MLPLSYFYIPITIVSTLAYVRLATSSVSVGFNRADEVQALTIWQQGHGARNLSCTYYKLKIW